MTVVIVGEAEREFAESVAYYEAKEAGLGWRFRTEVVEAVGWIERNAELPRLRAKGYRRRNQPTVSTRRTCESSEPSDAALAESRNVNPHFCRTRSEAALCFATPA